MNVPPEMKAFKDELNAMHTQYKTKARDQHDELNHLIDHLSDRLSDVASNIDKEFLAAYKAHMSEVQAELKQLKQQVILAEAALNDDTSVAKLETEVKWFSDEVTRLRTHAMSMKKDMNHIVSRCAVLNEQREFLNDQLKQVLKRSKVLEHELGIAATYAIDAQQQTTQLEPQDDDDGAEYDDGDGWDPYGNFDQLEPQVDGDGGGRVGRPRPPLLRDALLQHGGTSASPEKERARALYRGSAISQLDELFASRCPEEVVFERELEHIFKRIVARKLNEQVRSSMSTARTHLSGQPDDLQVRPWPAWKCPSHHCIGAHPGTPTRLTETTCRYAWGAAIGSRTTPRSLPPLSAPHPSDGAGRGGVGAEGAPHGRRHRARPRALLRHGPVHRRVQLPRQPSGVRKSRAGAGGQIR